MCHIHITHSSAITRAPSRAPQSGAWSSTPPTSSLRAPTIVLISQSQASHGARRVTRTWQISYSTLPKQWTPCRHFRYPTTPIQPSCQVTSNSVPSLTQTSLHPISQLERPSLLKDDVVRVSFGAWKGLPGATLCTWGSCLNRSDRNGERFNNRQ